MSNPMPIYSHVVPKSQYRKQASKNGATKERSSNLPRTEFDPLNYNHGGQFHLLNEPKYERPVKEARRSKEDYRSSRRTQKVRVLSHFRLFNYGTICPLTSAML